MALTDSQITVLRDELTLDPLGRGYAAMSDRAAADSLNAQDRSGGERGTVRGSEIFNALVPAEFAALSAEQQQRVRDVFALGDEIDVRGGTNTRQVLLNAFGAGATTRTNLAALVDRQQSRAEELGLPRLHHLDVAKARAA